MKKVVAVACCLLGFAAVLPQMAMAGDYYVALPTAEPAGSDSNPGTAEAPFATIAKGIAAAQAALADASTGDTSATVHVGEGEYTETGFVLDKAITVTGDAGDPSKVVINDAIVGRRAFTISHASALVEGLTIQGVGYYQGGNADNFGGHIYMTAGTVADCVITGGKPSSHYGGRGGNICMTGGTVMRCRVTDGQPSTYSTGSSYLRQGGNIWASGGTIANSLIANGKIVLNNASGKGANLYLSDLAKVVGCTVVGGTAAHADSAAGVYVANATVSVVDSAFYQNGGSAVKEWGNANGVVFNNCFFTDGTPLPNDSCMATLTADDFPAAGEGDYTPADDSALVDAGVSVQSGEIGNLDLVRSVRFVGAMDVGAYEAAPTELTLVLGDSAAVAEDGVAVTFSADTLAASGAVSWEWSVNGGAFAAGTSALTIENVSAGTLVVTVRATDSKQTVEGDFSPVRVVDPAEGIAEVFVSPTGADSSGNGLAERPFRTITAAKSLLDAYPVVSDASQTIHLAEGIYSESGFELDRAIVVTGDASDPSKVVINDAVAGKRAFTLRDAGARLERLTIGGLGYCGAAGSQGGHIYMTAGTVADCVITGGKAVMGTSKKKGYGGNIYMTGGRVVRCRVSGGTPTDYPTANSSESRGGNIWASGGLIENCLVENGTIVNKSTNDKGANIYLSGTAKAVNCSIVGGSAASALGGGVSADANTVSVVNCAIYGNGGSTGKEWGNANGSSFVNCAFASGLAPAAGTACIATVTDAAFVDYPMDCHPVKSGSVLVNAGTTWENYLDAGATSPVDLDGKPRKGGRRLDIGCYELPAGGMAILLR